MATVKADLIDDSGLEENKDGKRLTRVYFVKGLSGDVTFRHQEALNAVPARGTLHPTISFMQVKRRRVIPAGAHAAKVLLTYETPGGAGSLPELGETPQIEIGGVLVTARTNVDKDNQLIKISYTGSTNYPAIAEYVAEVDYQRPTFYVRYRRRESSNPSDTAAAFMGHVNSQSFAGKPARTWLMGPIVGFSDDGGDTYVVSYELYYNPNTWKGRVTVQYPDGKTPPDVTVGNGIAEPNVLPEANFNSLGL